MIYSLQSSDERRGGVEWIEVYRVWGVGYACHQPLKEFLPHCMQCRRGLAMRKLSVRLSVCLSNA